MKNGKFCILIVDDEEDLVELCSDSFIDAGFVAFTALNGVEALAICETEEIDAFIVDLFMPRLDGKQFLAEIRSNLEGNSLFYFATGSIELDLVGPGVTGLLLKPFDVDEVIEQITNDINLLLSDKIKKKALSESKVQFMGDEPAPAAPEAAPSAPEPVAPVAPAPAPVPEPVAPAPAPVPEPVAPAPAPVPEPVAPAPAPVPEPVAPAPAPVPEPVAPAPAPVPEPVAPAPAPVPEPVAPAPAPAAPEPAAPAPVPEPVAPAPVPEPAAPAPAAPEPAAPAPAAPAAPAPATPAATPAPATPAATPAPAPVTTAPGVPAVPPPAGPNGKSAIVDDANAQEVRDKHYVDPDIKISGGAYFLPEDEEEKKKNGEGQ